MTEKRKDSKTIVGTVTSDKMNKTITVQTIRMVQDKTFRKYVRRPQVFKAHDEKNEAKVGAKVKISSTRPLSKTKRWRLVEIIEQGQEE